jgi:hypothetical protein
MSLNRRRYSISLNDAQRKLIDKPTAFMIDFIHSLE